LVGCDRAGLAHARARAMHTFPVMVGFTLGCVLGAAFEAAAGLWTLGSAHRACLALLGNGFRRPPSLQISAGRDGNQHQIACWLQLLWSRKALAT
jgi:hypothetical protein